jgi:uncharacterized protein YndB with AHSA1/START domain
MTRVFDAPRELVFDAWTTPEHVQKWFGPRDWTLPFCEIDLRPGGKWRYGMRSPEGQEMWMGGTYQEIVRPELLVTTEIFDDWPDNEALNRLTLEEQDGKTTMTARCLYESVEVRDGVLSSGMEHGAGETMDRLAEHLEALV